MIHLPSTQLRRRQGRRRRTLWARLIRGTLYVKLGLALIALAAAAALYMKLSAGPLRFAGLTERVATALGERIGPNWGVAIADSSIELADGALALRTSGLDIRNPDGVLVLRAPDAIVSVDTPSMLTATVRPRAIEFRDLHLRALIAPDGSISFVPNADPSASEPTPSPMPAAAPQSDDPQAPSVLSRAFASLFDLLLETNGIIGGIDRARLVNARLTLVDQAGRERVAFLRVDANFDRVEAGSRRFEATLHGPRGSWRLAGETSRTPDGRQEGSATASDVPVQDILLLAGLSSLQNTTDLRVSGRVTAAMDANDRLTRLEGKLQAGEGGITIGEAKAPALRVEGAVAEAAWNEADRTLDVRTLSFQGGGTDLTLSGAWHAGRAGEGWRLWLSGRDGMVAGATVADQPFRVDEMRLLARETGTGLLLEELALRGPALGVAATGSYGTAEDRGGGRLGVRVTNSAARPLLRLWPASVGPNAREYLAENVQSGLVESLTIAANLSGEDIRRAAEEIPLPREAVQVEFTIADGVLSFAKGLPPLSNLRVTGRVDGVGLSVAAPRADIRMADGRAMTFSDGSFTIANLWPDDTIGQLDFKLAGGADALVSFLSSPAMQESLGVDLAPGSVKGQAALRVGAAIPLSEGVKFADIPIQAAGSLSDVAIDKAFGRDRLEGATLALSFDKGTLALKGEGRVAGSPVTIDLRQPAGQPGEVAIALTLDEAARARRGLSAGAKLTGAIPVRIVLPLAKGEQGRPKVEADLTRAVIDDLIPGFSKAAGRPAKLSFTLHEQANAQELRDFVLDSGATQLRGTVHLDGEGDLDKADLTTLKLSPGDEMRAQVDRAGSVYRVTLRGSVADARPLVKSLTTPSTGGRKRADGEVKDIDLDLSVPILTGFNDEALTGATVKASVRKGDLKQLQLNGRLARAAVSAQTVRGGNDAPVLVLQSADAGATLRFLDIYRRMIGGDLTLQVLLDETRQVGSLQMREFALRNEPALRRIISQQPVGGSGDRTASPELPVVNANEVLFTKAKAEFQRANGRIDFNDAVIWGTQIGFTLEGYLDPARDRADISGTFVPAYGLNNVFSQVPIVGTLLGGGQYEGLFAVNFRISGAASAPTLTVNPLSAIAPGIFRKFFGAGGATGSTSPLQAPLGSQR